MSTLIGQILCANSRLSQDNLDRALRLQSEEKTGRIGELLIRLGFVTSRDVAQALAIQREIPIFAVADFPDFPVLEDRISSRFLHETLAIPLDETPDTVRLALVDPAATAAVDAFRILTEKEVAVGVVSREDFDAVWERLYGKGRTAMGQIVDDVSVSEDRQADSDVQHLRDLASEAPVIRLVSLILRRALECRASDIHVEPFESRLAVRYRIDGVMHAEESPPRQLAAAIISRIKIMANLDIAERRLPQDGRIKLRIDGRDLDLRVSTVPTMHGESVVMRILDKGTNVLEFGALGFNPDTLSLFAELLQRPHGILLVTGPTGSGKTTTLYTALSMLNKPDVKILTVEDPVEYQLDGINQIQVKPQIDLSFANALRSIVRQDPDIIMIGEIRDLETAQIAVQSSLTGHLVLSTLHTNNAAGTINRLLDMGVEDYLLTSTVIGIEAQRLVRKLCPHCKEAYVPVAEVVDPLRLDRFRGGASGPVTLYRPKGCTQCAHTGYSGRISIIEILVVSDRIRSLVMRHESASGIQRAAVEEGMLTLFDDGMRRVLDGTTSIEEVMRVTRDED